MHIKQYRHWSLHQISFLSITSDTDRKRCRHWSLHHNAHGIMSSLNIAAMHREDVTDHYVHHNASNCHWAPCTQNITMHTGIMLMRNSSQYSKNEITVYTKWCQWTLYQNLHNMISSLNITSEEKEKYKIKKICRCWTLQHSYPCSWSDLDQLCTQKNVHWTLYQNTYKMPSSLTIISAMPSKRCHDGHYISHAHNIMSLNTTATMNTKWYSRWK